MKRLILTFIFSLAVLLAVLIPLNWVNETPAAQAQGNARVWVAHLAPFANTLAGTTVTVDVNGTEVLNDFQFGETSGRYLSVPAGSTLVEIKVGGMTAISDTFNLMAGMDYTVAAIGNNPDPNAYSKLDLYVVDGSDNNSPPSSGNGKVRVVHLAPFSTTITGTEVSVRSDDGFFTLPGTFRYLNSSGYVPLPAATYDLKVTDPGGSNTIIDIPPFKLADGEIVTVFAVGDVVNQPAGILPVVYSTAEVYVVHAAPFASAITDTAVTVRVNGTDALTDFKYLQTSGAYISLPSISTTVEIVAGGNTVTSDTYDLLPNTKYTVAAIGNDPTDPKDANQPVELLAMVDEEVVTSTAKVRIVHAAPFSNVLTDTQVDILTQDGGDLMLNGIAYKQFTVPYVQLSAGPYDLKINLAGTMTTAIDIPAFSLSNGDIATIFAVGDITNQSLGILTIPELSAAKKVYLPILFKN